MAALKNSEALPTVAAIASRLRSAEAFRELGQEVLLRMASKATWRSLKANALLWKRGQHAYEAAYVWSGSLRVERSDRKTVSYRRVPQGEGIGYPNALARIPFMADVRADADSRLLLLSGDALRALVPAHPELAFGLIGYLGGLIGRLSDDIEALHHEDVDARLLRGLQQLGRGKSQVELTHEALAEVVAARRESVSRALKKLESAGLVKLGRGRVILLARFPR